MTPAMSLGAVLLLAVIGGGAPGAVATRYTTAPDSLRTTWQGWLAGRDSVHVTHLQTVSRPVAFPTRLPCRFEVPIQHEDTWLAGDAARRLVAAFGFELARPNIPPCEIGGCAPDTAGGSDEIALEFRGEGRAIRFEFRPRLGNLNATDAEHFSWCGRPGPRAAVLLSVLSKTLPDDLRLAELVPCPDTLDAAPRPGTDPPFGDFVFVEELPQLVAPATPKYPQAAIDQGLEGTVAVHALVGKDGGVKRTRLSRPLSSDWLLEKSAVAAVEQYRFKPAMWNGKPVAVWVAVPVRFRFRD